MQALNQVFVGTGWGFPVRPAPDGGIAMATGEQEIAQSIYLILSTNPGERPMRPEFGTPLLDYVFEPADGRTFGRMSYVIEESLRRWEPRIIVEEIVVDADPDQEARIIIDLRYRIRGDYNRRNLLVPFYRIPGGVDE
jgi:phage baseplate assembly protein W